MNQLNLIKNSFCWFSEVNQVTNDNNNNKTSRVKHYTVWGKNKMESRNQQENFLSYDINEIINWSVICGSAASVSLDNTVWFEYVSSTLRSPGFILDCCRLSMTALLISALARQKYSGSLSKSAVTKLTKAKHLTPKYSKEHLSVLRYILFISTTESQSVQSWKGLTRIVESQLVAPHRTAQNS